MIRIKSFEDYLITVFGDIYSTITEKWLNPKVDKYGYSYVGLYRDNNPKWISIHRLVATTFIPNPYNKPEVNHIDGNKSNNCVFNLEWVTCSENQKHAYKIGLHKPVINEKHGRCKLTNNDVLVIHGLYLNYSLKFIEKCYDIGQSQIYRLINGESRSIEILKR